MKTKLLFILLSVTFLGFSQTQPILINGDLLEQPKASGSDCSCAGWLNKPIGSQGENSSDSRAANGDAVKFDNLEADLMYQEVAVEANSNYTFSYNYRYSEGSSDTPSDPFVVPTVEVIILKGSGYDSGYTILYQDGSDATTFRDKDYGYSDIASVENVSNQLNSTTHTDPGNSDYVTTSISFDTGTETSIAILLRATGNTGNYVDGSYTYDWFSGDSEVRIGSVSLVNNGSSLSTSDVLASKFKIYPNPAQDHIQIDSNSINISSVEMYNIIGKRLISEKNLVENKLDISSLNSGVYLLKINALEGSLVKKNIVE